MVISGIGAAVHSSIYFNPNSFRLSQFVDSDAVESEPVFQAVGDGGRGPPHVREHEESPEGEERGQVR